MCETYVALLINYNRFWNSSDLIMLSEVEGVSGPDPGCIGKFLEKFSECLFRFIGIDVN